MEESTFAVFARNTSNETIQSDKVLRKAEEIDKTG